MNPIEKRTIFVIAFDPTTDGSVGGSEWRLSEPDARDYFEYHVTQFPSDNVRLFRLDVEAELSHDDITEEADDAAWQELGETMEIRPGGTP